MKTYSVTLPIAGHLCLSVEADSASEAVDKAMEDASLSDIEGWEVLKQFNQGNVCHCPHPWEAEAVCTDGDEEDE